MMTRQYPKDNDFVGTSLYTKFFKETIKFFQKSVSHLLKSIPVLDDDVINSLAFLLLLLEIFSKCCSHVKHKWPWKWIFRISKQFRLRQVAISLVYDMIVKLKDKSMGHPKFRFLQQLVKIL